MNFPLKAILVEDDPADVRLFKSKIKEFNLKDYFYIETIVETVDEAIKAYKKNSYDLSIFDIKLSGGSDCFEIIRHIGKEPLGIITLTTRHEQRHIAEVARLKYIYLPKHFNMQSCADFIRDLNEEVKIMNEYLEEIKVVLPLCLKDDRGQRMFFEQKRIVFIEVRGNLLKVRYLNEKNVVETYSYTGTLKELDGKLSSLLFYRLGKNYLVNLQLLINEKDGNVFVRDEKGLKPIPLPTKKQADFLGKFIRLRRK